MTEDIITDSELAQRAEKEGIVNCEGRHFYVKAVKSAKGRIWLKEVSEDMAFSKDAGKYGNGRTFPLWNHKRGFCPWVLMSESHIVRADEKEDTENV